MRAHLVQFDIAWENHAANVATVDRLLAQSRVEPGDLVLLPEMFSTGFSLNTGATADTGDTVLAYLKGLAARLGIWVQGGRTVRAPGSVLATNEAPIITPKGAVNCSYQKIHPFSYGREPERFAGGDRVMTYRWGRERRDAEPDGGITVCPAICYDLRFPELFRRGLAMGAECYAIGANWPRGRQAHWRALLIARAIENQAFVLGVNRTGRDPTLEYAGGSIAVGPKGDVLGELGVEEAVLSVEVDPSAMREWRATFPAWRDGKIERVR